MNRERIDEFLELCWILWEKQLLARSTEQDVAKEFAHHRPRLIEGEGLPDAGEVIQASLAEGLIVIDQGRMQFTESGQRRAATIIRRHRLAEKLFTDILELPYRSSEGTACKFEHILSPEVTDSVCTFLGHPPLCPHGKPIPRGDCCNKWVRELKPIVMPLAELTPGQSAKIVFISSMHPERLQRLSSMGIIPGTQVTLNQKSPSYIINVEQMQIALDAEIVSEIYVKRSKIA
jgi:DtxR family Mn-dependent transcriptional regulator